MDEGWEIDTGNAAGLAMSSEDRASFLRARQLLQPLGVSLEVAASQYAEACKILGNIPPLGSGPACRKGLQRQETECDWAIGAFAGLRHAEIGRLDWKDVSLLTGYITVQAAKAKTASRRIVPITANLGLWLAPHAKAAGLVCSDVDMSKPLLKFVTKLRFQWKHNALRHSLISYRVADVKDVARVALEARNSPAMIFKHYRELVTEKAAKDWFAVAPSGGEAIIPMAA